jgi:hypothetical protein
MTKPSLAEKGTMRFATTRYKFLFFTSELWNMLPSYIDREDPTLSDCVDATFDVLVDKFALAICNFIFVGQETLISNDKTIRMLSPEGLNI